MNKHIYVSENLERNNKNGVTGYLRLPTKIPHSI